MSCESGFRLLLSANYRQTEVRVLLDGGSLDKGLNAKAKVVILSNILRILDLVTKYVS